MTKVERSKSTPNITVSAGVVNNQELGLNQALLGLSVPIPLFDRNQGSLQEAISRQYQAQDKLTALKTQLSTKLAEAHARLSVAKHSVASLREEILPGAQSAFDAANKGFSAGKFNFLDVLDAQRTLFQVKSKQLCITNMSTWKMRQLQVLRQNLTIKMYNQSSGCTPIKKVKH